MTDQRTSNYFKIGIFVIVGISLIVIGILVLGSGKLFQRTFHIETYFNESVQGLSIGSPVKYRGMTIGQVDKISLVSAVYPGEGVSIEDSRSRYIYIDVVITSDLLTDQPKAHINKMLQHDVAKGMRIKLALQGLTGNAYLELNFEDPKTNPPLPITWTPKNCYIPSTTSTLTRLSDNVGYLLDELKKVNIDKMFNEFENLIGTTNAAMGRFDDLIASTKNQIVATTANMQQTSTNLREISEDAKSYPSHVIFGQPPGKLDPHNL